MFAWVNYQLVNQDTQQGNFSKCLQIGLIYRGRFAPIPTNINSYPAYTTPSNIFEWNYLLLWYNEPPLGGYAIATCFPSMAPSVL